MRGWMQTTRQPEWAHLCLGVAVLFFAVFLAHGGANTVLEFAEVLPFMLMGGMCSEDLMHRILVNGAQLGIACMAMIGFTAAETHKHGAWGRFARIRAERWVALYVERRVWPTARRARVF